VRVLGWPLLYQRLQPEQQPWAWLLAALQQLLARL
jgi:hypothetical protein